MNLRFQKYVSVTHACLMPYFITITIIQYLYKKHSSPDFSFLSLLISAFSPKRRTRDNDRVVCLTLIHRHGFSELI